MNSEAAQAANVVCVYATNKLRGKLTLDGNNEIPRARSVERSIGCNPLSGWHAHLKILQRRQCVIFIHDQSRFPLILPCLKKPDFEKLDWYFQDVFMNTLLRLGMPSEVVNEAANHIAPLRFDHTLDRSVMGTLNQITADLEHQLWYERQAINDLLPYSTSAWLADRPCRVKGEKDCIWPVDAMRKIVARTIH